ncbi:MAG: MBL fold metallo-hydrolase [Bacillota bacterium]|nr:MBL fold metallo-hydrolase [Bacillota bacterium]MDD3297403.1 MBL fold metallo-hydrolase [Bacillota bacterium]MDD3851459.1 MBL fold metallo-hydrolase [Bacillota bacterium]MDD4707172.1 MBL fold metallo-hydrolase [Bacillota bacterium]
MGELLKKIKGNTYYIKGPVNTGLYVYSQNRCVVIDTGSSDDWGRKILKALKAEGLEAELIINTHSHADHFGGNSFLVKRTNAEVAASGIEAAIISNPYLEPFYLYSAHPPKALQNKFLMGKECRVDRILEPGTFPVGPAKLQIVDLKGHSPGQIGVATPDGVLMTADAYFSTHIVEKYKLPYFTNIADTLDTLKGLKGTDYSFYLPCHGDLSSNIEGEIDSNLKAISEAMGTIRWALIKPLTREELGAAITEKYGLDLNTTQYYLNQSSIAAYLSYMTDQRMLQRRIEGYRMVWEVV